MTRLCLPLIIFLLFLRDDTVLGKLECEDLAVEACAFSVSSSGSRCVVESLLANDGSVHYECQSSNVMAGNYMEWIESEDCISACGVERMTVGLSTDSLVDSSAFIRMLCSSECQSNCPNIFDLYTSLAAGEGVSLAELCDDRRLKSRKLIGSGGIWASDSSNTLNAWTASAPSTLESQSLAAAPASQPSAAA